MNSGTSVYCDAYFICTAVCRVGGGGGTEGPEESDHPTHPPFFLLLKKERKRWCFIIKNDRNGTKTTPFKKIEPNRRRPPPLPQHTHKPSIPTIVMRISDTRYPTSLRAMHVHVYTIQSACNQSHLTNNQLLFGGMSLHV